MEYAQLEEAGQLAIEYRGRPLDAFSVAVLHFSLQDIFDRVAWATLEREGMLGPRYSRFRPPYAYARRFGHQFVRAEIQEIRSGSLLETIAFLIPAVIADPDIRAVLQNLAANIIYQIGASHVRHVSSALTEPDPLMLAGTDPGSAQL